MSLKPIEYILVVEDDVDVRAAITLYLQMDGYKTVSSGNGLEALKILTDPHRINHPGLILLDLEMPVMTGWELLNVIAACPSIKGIPLIVTTGIDHPVVAEYPVMRKPYIIEDLITLIKSKFPHGAESQATAVRSQVIG